MILDVILPITIPTATCEPKARVVYDMLVTWLVLAAPSCSIFATLNNKAEALEALLSAGADVHATTTSADTALHWAAYKVVISFS